MPALSGAEASRIGAPPSGEEERIPPVVTIVMHAHDVEDHVEQAIRSALAQTLESIEVIVVDTASSDRTGRIVELLAVEEARVRSVSLGEEADSGEALNAGIDVARGRYVLILDGDEVFSRSDAVARLVAIAEREQADFVRGRQVGARGEIRSTSRFESEVFDAHVAGPDSAGCPDDLADLFGGLGARYGLYRLAFIRDECPRFASARRRDIGFEMAAFLRSRRVAFADVHVVIRRLPSDEADDREAANEDFRRFVDDAELVGTYLDATDTARDASTLLFMKRRFVTECLIQLLTEPWLVPPERPVERVAVDDLLERLVRLFEDLEVGSTDLDTAFDAPGHAFVRGGELRLLYELLLARRFDLATAFSRQRSSATSWVYSLLLSAEGSELGRAINHWLSRRDWSEDHEEARRAGERAERRHRASLPRVVLHIGSTKTGSTYLQDVCDSNRAELLRRGVWYPGFGYFRQPSRPHKTGGHARFVGAAKEGDESLRDLIFLGLERIPIGIHTVVISSEAFFLADEETIAALVEYFDAFPLQVAVYLRRQDEWARSQYCELVAGGAVGRVVESFDEWREEASTRALMDYAGLLDTWASRVGEGLIRVRPFEKQKLGGEKLLFDFVRIIGIDHPERLTISERVNRNTAVFSDDQIHALRFFNRLRFANIEHYFAFTEEVGSKLNARDVKPAAVVSPTERRAILRQFDAANRSVAKRFLDREDGALFSELAIPASGPVDRSSNAVDVTRLGWIVEAYARHAPLPSHRPPLPPNPIPAPRTLLVLDDPPPSLPEGRLLRDSRGRIWAIEVGGKCRRFRFRSLRRFAGVDFIQAVSLCASEEVHADLVVFERYAEAVRSGLLTKRRAAAEILRRYGGGIAASHLPLRAKLALWLSTLLGRLPPTLEG